MFAWYPKAVPGQIDLRVTCRPRGTAKFAVTLLSAREDASFADAREVGLTDARPRPSRGSRARVARRLGGGLLVPALYETVIP